MLNALDNLPEDPVELRRVTELLASEVKAQALMIEKLQHQLHGANRHRFGSKSEGMDQLQLFAENEEIAEAAVKAAETAPAEPIELKEKPRRKPLPDHLERIEQVCLLARIALSAVAISQSWAKILPKSWNTSPGRGCSEFRVTGLV